MKNDNSNVKTTKKCASKSIKSKKESSNVIPKIKITKKTKDNLFGF